MSNLAAPQYFVRDAAGNSYGPATLQLLQQWIAEGRITPQMQVSVSGTDQYRTAAEIPELANAFALAAQRISPSALAQATASPVTPAYNYAPAKSQGMAIASLVCGCGGFMCAILPILAIIFGHIARGQIRREPERYNGAGMALAGLILGYCWIALIAIVIVIYALIFVVVIGAAARGGSGAPRAF